MSILSFVRRGRTTKTPAQRRDALSRACVESLETRRFMTATNPVLISQGAAGAGDNNSPSLTSPGEPGFGPKISDTGHYVAFDSSATNLDAAVTVSSDEVYLRDTVANTTKIVSVDSAGQPLANSYIADMTGDGRYVLFFARPNPGSNPNQVLLYRRDTVANNTVIISVGYDPNPLAPPTVTNISVSADPATHKPTVAALISANGNRVVFSTANSYVIRGVNDANLTDDLFVRDINAQRSFLVSAGLTNTSTAPATGRFYSLSMNDAGNRVAFDTDRSGLGNATTNSTALRRVLVRNLTNNTYTDVSAGATGTGGTGTSAGTSTNPFISKDGSAVAFLSDSPSLAGITDTTTIVTPQVYVAKLDGSGAVSSISLASTSIGGSSSAGTALALSRPSTGGNFVAFYSDATDLVPNSVTGTNLYRYDLANDKVALVTLNATNTGTTNFDPKIGLSDDGRYLTWAMSGTNLDLSITNYGAAGQVNAYIRDMQSFTVRLLNVSLADPAVASNVGVADPAISADGKFSTFDSIASNLATADTNAFRDVFDCPTPTFPVAVVTPLLNAPDVFFGGSTVYYFTVTYNSALPVKLSTLSDGDITVTFQGLGFSTPAKLLAGSVNRTTDGTPVSATYYITPPGGSWDTTDNSNPADPNVFNSPSAVRYVVHLNAAQVADVQGTPFPDLDIGSFQVQIPFNNQDGPVKTQAVAENVSTHDVTVSFKRTDAFPGPITVNYSTAPGSATPGSDYTPVTGTLTFNTNETKTITVPILDDALLEGDETFRILLTGATNGALFDAGQYLVTILDDESPTVSPTPPASGGTIGIPGANPIGPIAGPGGSTIAVNQNVTTITAPETLGALTIPVTRAGTGTTASAATFTYTVYATPEDTAVANQNFAPIAAGTLSFAPGSDTPTSPLVVQLLHDHQVTGDRTFTVVLTNATNGLAIAGASFKVVVQDIDSAVLLAPIPLTTNDDAGILTLPVYRIGNLATPSKVNASFSGTAFLGTDFTIVDDGVLDQSGFLYFAAGQSEIDVHVRLVSQPFDPESSKTLTLTLSAPSATTAPYETVLGSPSAETLVIDNLDASAPQVASVDLKVKAGKITGITVTFSEDVVATAARKLANYTLFTRTRDGKLGNLVKLTAGKYDPATHTVTLTTAAPLAQNQVYQLNVAGKGNITDLAGNKLNNNAGSSIALLGYGRSLTYTDRDNDLVSFNLKGPGALKLVSLNNNVTLDVLAPNPDTSTLLGTIAKRKPGNGHALINLLRLRGATFDPGNKFTGDIRADV